MIYNIQKEVEILNERLVKLVGNMTYIENNIYVMFYANKKQRERLEIK